MLSPALASSGRSLFRGSVSLPPSPARPAYDDAAVRLLASTAARRGQVTKAGRLVWDLLVSNPGDRDMRLALATLMLQRDQPLEALSLLEERLAADCGDEQVAERKAFVLMQLGRLEDARRIYSRLVDAHPTWPQFLHARGQIEIALGHEQAAVHDYRRALRCDPGYGQAWWALANIKTFRFSADDRHAMDSLLARGTLTPESGISLEFALGKALEDAGEYERSFAHYHRGNELRAQSSADPSEVVKAHVNQVIAMFSGENLAVDRFAPAATPIFIVGMPRSGTTLVEQILASHPEVEGTFELPSLPTIARSIGEGLGRSDLDYSSLLAGCSSETLRKLGENYLTQSAAYRRTRRLFFIDKMPSNWMHVALIRLILPTAKIIDVRRDPLDCCFSNFAQNFPAGHEFTQSLARLGAHYRSYDRLMTHFDAAGSGAVSRVCYEDLVRRPDQMIGALLDRAGLPFADTCLRFFENPRAVRTPSAQQVRQPINSRSIGRWRPYERWLVPLMGALRPG